MIDTGVDYKHPAFQTLDGSSRILSIWDQSIQNGPAPETFSFGTEYTREEINAAIISENPQALVLTEDTDGHGTAMLSILAGTPNKEGTFAGAACETDLIVVKLKEAKENLKQIFFISEDKVCYQESDILLGIRYSLNIAKRLNRPIVICLAMQSNQGSHDGLGIVSSYLDHLSLLPGIGIVIAAGNQGNNQRHYFNSTTTTPYSNDMELRIGEGDRVLSLQIWGTAPSSLSIEVSSPNRESTEEVFPSLTSCRKFTFIFNETVIWINNYSFEAHTGEQLIMVRFLNATPGIWHLKLRNPENEPFSFHSWLPAGYLISDETFFINPNPNLTITSPGNSRHQLTVTAYNQVNGTILPESGRGYTRSGEIKPDIAAPGYQIPCALPRNRYGTATGTGAAAAQAAGIVAMIFEWAIVKANYPRITGNNANHLIISGAVRDQNEDFPNNVWGYGRIQAEHVFERVLGDGNSDGNQ